MAATSTRARARSARGPAPAAPRHVRRDVQGLRALAVLAVIIYHAGLPLPGGYAGVDVFFVISGFVITAMLEREATLHGRVRLLRFYQRRFKRLTPALAAVIAVTMAASALVLTPFGQQQITAKTGIGALAFVANLILARGTGGYFDPSSASNPLLHTWSLSVEEQFYFVFPLLFVLCWRLGRAALVAAVAAVAVASFALASIFTTQWPLGFYSPATRAWEFALGALGALAVKALSRRTASGAAFVGLAMLLGFFLLVGDVRWPGPWTLIPALGTLLCILAGSDATHTNPVSRLLGSKPLETVGDYSYSLYLWHWPFISLFTTWHDAPWVGPLAAFLSVVPAVLSYRFVEEPFRHRSIIGMRQWAVAAVAVLLLPAVSAASLVLGQRSNWGSAAIANVAHPREIHPGWDDCLRLDTSGNGTRPLNEKACTFGSSSSGPKVFLVGDSNAAMYSEAAIGAAQRLHGTLVERTAAGCPLADAYRSWDGSMGPADHRCRDFVTQTMKELAAAPRGTVVFIGAAPSQWLLPERGYSLTPSGFRSDFSGRREVLKTAFTKTLRTLKDSGLRPVLIEPMVTFPEGAPPNSVASCRTTASILLGTCPTTLALEDAEKENATLREDMRSVATAAGAGFVSIAARQCPDGRCPPSLAGASVLMDNGHFSSPFATSLVDDFYAASQGRG